MSEQILRNPKKANTGANNFAVMYNQRQSNEMISKVVNPLSRYSSNKDSNDKKQKCSTIRSTFHNTKDSGANNKIQNFKNKNFELVQPKLKNPNFNFYAADLNSSSDASFMNTTFKDSRLVLEQKIALKFNNSKSQLQELVLKSPSKKMVRQDKKQAKRQKLKFYHCDQIIIRPALSNQPVKVFELAICPTKNSQPKQCILNNKNLKNTLQCQKKFMDLLEESPLENNKSFNHHQCIMDSPSFLETVEEQRQSTKPTNQQKINFQKGNKKINNFSEQVFYKEENFETKSNTSHHSHHSPKSLKSIGNFLQKRINQTKEDFQNQQNIEGVPNSHFKKRNRIFTNDKKYGLKLSRVIKHEKQIQMLKGQLGVDVFHIIIQEDQFLKHCCT